MESHESSPWHSAKDVEKSLKIRRNGLSKIIEYLQIWELSIKTIHYWYKSSIIGIGTIHIVGINHPSKTGYSMLLKKPSIITCEKLLGWNRWGIAGAEAIALEPAHGCASRHLRERLKNVRRYIVYTCLYYFIIVYTCFLHLGYETRNCLDDPRDKTWLILGRVRAKVLGDRYSCGYLVKHIQPWEVSDVWWTEVYTNCCHVPKFVRICAS